MFGFFFPRCIFFPSLRVCLPSSLLRCSCLRRAEIRKVWLVFWGFRVTCSITYYFLVRVSLAGNRGNTRGNAMVRPGLQRDHRGDYRRLHYLCLESRRCYVDLPERVRCGSQVRELPAGRRTAKTTTALKAPRGRSLRTFPRQTKREESSVHETTTQYPRTPLHLGFGASPTLVLGAEYLLSLWHPCEQSSCLQIQLAFPTDRRMCLPTPGEYATFCLKLFTQYPWV